MVCDGRLGTAGSGSTTGQREILIACLAMVKRGHVTCDLGMGRGYPL